MIGESITRNAPYYLGLGLSLLVEARRPARPWRVSRRRRLTVHLAMGYANGALSSMIFFYPLIWSFAYTAAHGWGLLYCLGLPVLARGLLAMVLLDLGDYWIHRALHFTVLWKVHQVHHSDTHIDGTSVLRTHFAENAIFLSARLVAAWTLGVTLWEVSIYTALFSLSSSFHHANVELPAWAERRLHPWIVTPRSHVFHHLTAVARQRQNLGIVSNVWDRLFGTAYYAAAPADPELGLAEVRQGDLTFSELFTVPFRRTRSHAG